MLKCAFARLALAFMVIAGCGLGGGSALAQPPATAAQVQKFAVIHSGAFYDDDRGVKSVVTAINVVDREFKPRQTSLQALARRSAVAEKELLALETRGAPISDITAKASEADLLGRDLARQDQDSQAAYAQRFRAVVQPVQERMSNGLKAYLSGKGYTDVIDLDAPNAPRPPPGAIDETAGFIAWYNAQP